MVIFSNYFYSFFLLPSFILAFMNYCFDERKTTSLSYEPQILLKNLRMIFRFNYNTVHKGKVSQFRLA